MSAASTRNAEHKLLFHWSGKEFTCRLCRHRRLAERLSSILTDGVALTVKNELLNVGPYRLRLARPFACFTDIPLSRTQTHAEKYGGVGVGITKASVISRGGSPVAYYGSKNISTESLLTSSLVGLVETTLPRVRKSSVIQLDEGGPIADLLHYCKEFGGTLSRGGRGKFKCGCPDSTDSTKHEENVSGANTPAAGKREGVTKNLNSEVAPRRLAPFRRINAKLNHYGEAEWRLVGKSDDCKDEEGKRIARCHFKLGTELVCLVIDSLETWTDFQDTAGYRLLAASPVPVNVYLRQELAHL